MEEGERLAAKQADLEGAMKRLRQQVRGGHLGEGRAVQDM